MEHLAELPEPTQGVVRRYIQGDKFDNFLRDVTEKHNLDSKKKYMTYVECMMVLCGISTLENLTDSLISEAELDYETSLRIKSIFERDIISEINSEVSTLIDDDGLSDEPHTEPSELTYVDSWYRVEGSTLHVGGVGYSVRSISKVAGPFREPMMVGGLLVNVVLFLVGIALLMSFSLWSIGGLLLCAITGFVIYSAITRGYFISVYLNSGEDFNIEKKDRDGIIYLHRALAAAIERG
jgi:hypothetical protein